MIKCCSTWRWFSKGYFIFLWSFQSRVVLYIQETTSILFYFINDLLEHLWFEPTSSDRFLCFQVLLVRRFHYAQPLVITGGHWVLLLSLDQFASFNTIILKWGCSDLCRCWETQGTWPVIKWLIPLPPDQTLYPLPSMHNAFHSQQAKSYCAHIHCSELNRNIYICINITSDKLTNS